VPASGIPPGQDRKISAVSINGLLPNPEKRRIGSPPFIPPGKPGNFPHPPAGAKSAPAYALRSEELVLGWPGGSPPLPLAGL